jgi:hypothetical protein
MKKLLPYVLLLLLAIVTITIKQCGKASAKKATNTTVATDVKQPRGLNRHPSHINYSKHAKCRMDCRHIDASEITDILENGTINYKKSELQGEDCKKKYAVEGYSKDKQHLRVIFAPCADEVTVVTCIDIGTEWACDCK